MNILLWVLQVLLALAFFAHGGLMLFPPPAIAEQMNASLPRWFQLFLGVAEILAAVGLTLPGVTRIQPWLVPCAAAGIMIVMICASVFHLTRGEVSSALSTIVLRPWQRSSRICAGGSFPSSLDALPSLAGLGLGMCRSAARLPRFGAHEPVRACDEVPERVGTNL
jgi:hypothetical protein